MAFLNSVFCDHPVLNTDNFLALELMNPGSILHPTISRGIIRRHGDTLPWEHEPWFYRDLDDLTVREVTTLSNEYLVLKGVLFDRFGIDLSSVIPIRDWLTRSYPQDVVDKTNFKTMLTSNRPYRVAALPCVKQADGKYLPDYEHRYVREEIPCSSVVIKGIAVLAGVLTPQLDEIIGKQPYNRAPSPLPRYGP
ncbi:MAG: NAD/NADP octopine/nopaline dehydrogenase, alpha-helical domain [Syntrophorhabdaceae bacterium PtaU1.Bin034]|nr:MAG: NAD/NADP octopine/nopaline dehydrogenase, alpha-helical domain [Syntrophorhabdaceae bacterium PtaU1.Bin034]